MLNLIRRFVKEEEGASAAEYAVLITLITLFLVASVGGLGTAIQGALNGAAAVINPS
jgi:Flp pilus assembly pilin Flp